MTSFYILFAVVVALWLLSLVSCLLAIRWSVGAAPRRFWAAIISSILAIVIGYCGMTRFHISYSRTVNASQWSIDSKWFFILPLLLGALSLVFAIRSRKNSHHGV